MEPTIPRRSPIALSNLVPLRKSTAWGNYVNVRILPHVYGRTTVEPIPFDREGFLFVIADHSIQGVDRVSVADQATEAYAFRNGSDELGHAVAILELAEALKTGETLAVDVRGKLRHDTGALLVEPGLVVWDLVSNIGGQALPLSDFDRFRAETAGDELHGAFNAEVTLRAQVDELMRSVGAIWSGGMPGFARRYPAADDVNEPSRETYTEANARGMTAEATASDIVTRLRLLYAFNHAKKEHGRVLEVNAPDAAQVYGDLERELDARWVRSPTQAAALAERLIERLARPAWHLRFSAPLKAAERKIPRAGTVVTVNHARAPVSGRMLVTGSDMDPANLQVAVSASASVGDVPRWVLAHLSTAHEPLVAESVAAVFVDGVATFTIFDDNRRPLSNASVTLNGAITKVSDRSGRVQFTTPRGKHTLRIVASGFADRLVDLTL